MADANEPENPPRGWARVIIIVIAAMVVLVGVPLVLICTRAEQEQRQAGAEVREAMAAAGIPVDRRAWVETLPVVHPLENLATPFDKAGSAITTESPLWEAVGHSSDHPELEAYAPSEALRAEDILAAPRTTQPSADEILSDVDVEISPQVRTQIEALAALAGDTLDYDALDAPQQWALVRAVVEENQAALDALAAVPEVAPGEAVKADFGVAWDDFTVPMVELEFAYLNQQRNLSRLLRHAAMIDAANGDLPAALVHVRQMHVQAAAMDAASQTLVQHLVAVGADVNASQTLQVVLESAGPIDPQVRPTLEQILAWLLDESRIEASRRASWEGELVFERDFLDRIDELAADYEGGAVALADHLTGAKLERNRTVLTKFLLEVIDATSATSLPEAKEALPSPYPVERQIEEERLVWVAELLPAGERSFVADFRRLADRRRALIQVAMLLYRLDHGGRLPATLDELVPGYLPHVPLDPLTRDAPLQYDPGRRRVWSVGEDGIDHGGITPEEVGHQNPDLGEYERHQNSDRVTRL